MISPTEGVGIVFLSRFRVYTWRIFGTCGFTSAYGACVERRSSEKIEHSAEAPRANVLACWASPTRVGAPDAWSCPETTRTAENRREILFTTSDDARENNSACESYYTGLFATQILETRVSDYRISDCDRLCLWTVLSLCLRVSSSGSPPIRPPKDARMETRPAKTVMEGITHTSETLIIRS